MDAPLNVLGSPIRPCSHEPLTGWYRDGCCNTDPSDHGSHTVCCRLTDEFLRFLQQRGNDLITPQPTVGFPGLKAGDQWCVCVGSWAEAHRAGVACPVFLEGTHQRALDVVELEDLLRYAIASEA